MARRQGQGNNMNRQQTKILQLLRHYKNKGINSFEWRQAFIQLPVRIKELRSMGYSIIVKNNVNRSVNYILLSEPKQEKPKEQPKYKWVFENNVARQVEIEPFKPQQLEML